MKPDEAAGKVETPAVKKEGGQLYCDRRKFNLGGVDTMQRTGDIELCT